MTINIQGLNVGEAHLIHLKITDMLGKNVYEAKIESITENTLKINPEINFAGGIYMVEAVVNNAVLRKKLIVE